MAPATKSYDHCSLGVRYSPSKKIRWPTTYCNWLLLASAGFQGSKRLRSIQVSRASISSTGGSWDTGWSGSSRPCYSPFPTNDGHGLDPAETGHLKRLQQPKPNQNAVSSL